MGGSGGGFFSGKFDPADLASKTRKEEGKAIKVEFETSTSNFLADQLAQYNDRDTEGIQAVFQEVKDEMQDFIKETVDLLYGGSVSKHTYIDGLSDVDALVLIDGTKVKGKNPSELRGLLAKVLRGRYGRESVTIGNLAVTLLHKGNSIQLLPALREKKGFKISSYDGKSWSRINPTGFANALTKANKAMDGKLVPCIKLAKAIVSLLPEQRRLTGYHTESLAIQVFKDYSGPRTPKNMVRHFFEKAPDHVKQPIIDSSGQSIHVDEYLGQANSLKRQIVSDSLSRIARRIRNADGAGSLESWKELFP